MKKLNKSQLGDLGKLAVDRCGHSFGSVAQLIDNGPQLYALALTVACTFITTAADLLQDGMEDQTGKRPPRDEILNHVVCDALDGVGVRWKRSKLPIRSARK